MTDTPSTIIKDLQKAIKDFGNKDAEETMNKILEGQKLSEDELEEAFYSILPWMSLSLLNKKYKSNKLEAQEHWDSLLGEKLDLETFGSVEHLEILPLIDAKTEDTSLKAEHGVSYLIKADDTTILFDVGLNKKREHPSPLLYNMEKLGVNISDVDNIFITHPHGDHCGGGKWIQDRSFGLSGERHDLNHLTTYTPIEMNHPTAKLIHVTKPLIIGKGLASIGPIKQPMFLMDITIEQSLVVNLKGKGLVVIIGCGHQSVSSILERTENIVDKKIPIYGFIGGIHLPIPKFPNVGDWMGIPFYKFMGTRRPIWEPWSEKDVQDAIQSLKTRKVKIISISTHDSSDESIEAFRSEFENYVDLRVGKPIMF